VEGSNRFPEFEKRIEKGLPVAYHEEWNQREDIVLGGFLTILGFLPLLWLDLSFGLFQILGFITSFIGVLVLARGVVLYRRLIKQYSFHGLTRKTISDAIMHIDAQLAQPEEFDSPVLYHDKTPVSKYKMSLNEAAFRELLANTSGLITWPSAIVEEHESNVRNDKRAFYYSLLLLIIIIVIVVMIIWYLLTAWDWSLLAFIFIPLFCLLQTSWCLVPHIFELHRYLIKDEWIAKVRKNDTIRLSESLDELFHLLQSEFSYPLKLELVRTYPQLTYTGRTKLSYTLVNLKEAVLYPLPLS